MIHWGTFLAYAMTGLALCASLAYLLDKNYRLALYWFLVASINLTVSYGA